MAVIADVATIQQASTDTNTAQQDISSKLATLRNLMQDMAGGWEGQAATSFQSLMEHFDKEGQDMMNALEAIADMLKSTGHAIEQNEEEQNAVIGKFGAI